MVWTRLSRYADFGLLVLRLGIGISFMIHGLGKIQGGQQTLTMVGSSMSKFGITGGYYFFGLLAAFGEMLGGLLFAFGAFFRPACLLLIWIMVVALTTHLTAKDPQMGSFNAYSHALDLLCVFFALLFVGPGKFSVDRK